MDDNYDEYYDYSYSHSNQNTLEQKIEKSEKHIQDLFMVDGILRTIYPIM